MKPQQWLGTFALMCFAVTLCGWWLVHAGMHNKFSGGDPGWGNLAAIVWGMLCVLAVGGFGVSLSLAALSERRRWVAWVALAGNALSVLGAVVFVACMIGAVLVPKVADLDLRREFLRIESDASLATLDRLALGATYVPLDTPTMRLTAEPRTELRATGRPTESDDAHGVDVILAAQALLVGATVVTDNPKHLGRMVDTTARDRVLARS